MGPRNEWASERMKVEFDGNLAEFKKWLTVWLHDFETWGQNVRVDIVRLEAQTGVASGDPGDPPGGPF